MMEKDSFWPTTLKALVYADIFSFPLTAAELWQRLISPPPGKKKDWEEDLRRWRKEGRIGFQQGYYFLPGREELVRQRLKGEKIKKKKLLLARKAALLLASIPLVSFVGLSGNLAAGTAREEDDLDLMIITFPNTLWLARILVYLLLLIQGKRAGLFLRRPREKEVKDKLCLNLFLDETDLVLEEKEKNLFTAHEIVFLHPLINKRKSYQRFLAANSWVKDFLPHGFPGRKGKFSPSFSFFLLDWLNRLCFLLQRFYMRGKPAGKKVTLTQAFFHPHDLAPKTLSRFQKRLSQLPLDKEKSYR